MVFVVLIGLLLAKANGLIVNSACWALYGIYAALSLLIAMLKAMKE